MKIAFLNMYSGYVDRGAETFVYEVAQRLEEKHDVTVFQGGPKNGREKYKVVSLGNIDWTRRDTSRTTWAYLLIDYWRRKILEFSLRSAPKIFEERYEIVVPVNGSWMPVVMRIVTWLYGGRMIISGQSGVGLDDVINLFSFPDTFVALSSHAKEWAKSRNPFVKIEYIPNGTDVKRFDPAGEKIGTKLKHPIVVCVGALVPGKRIDLVIQAVAKLKEVSLLVVGDGDWRNELDKLGRVLLGNRFELKKVAYEQIPEIYRAADLFTLVSAPYHSFEIVIVEAMATGLGVVVNDDPIRREIVGDAGLFVDPTNAEDYAAALKKALDVKWGDKPRKQAEKFSWDKIAKQYEKLFNQLKQ